MHALLRRIQAIAAAGGNCCQRSRMISSTIFRVQSRSAVPLLAVLLVVRDEDTVQFGVVGVNSKFVISESHTGAVVAPLICGVGIDHSDGQGLRSFHCVLVTQSLQDVTIVDGAVLSVEAASWKF